jgi:mono/diheme cytochrome c family protein
MRVLKVLLCATCTVLPGCDSGGDEESRTQKILGLSGDAAMGAMQFLGNQTATTDCGAADCHGPDGAGGPDAPSPAPQSLNVLVPERTDEKIIDTLLAGLGNMPAQTGRSDQELANILAYLNEEFAN